VGHGRFLSSDCTALAVWLSWRYAKKGHTRTRIVDRLLNKPWSLSMLLENIEVADISGWHDDGWCAPFVRGRLIARSSASRLIFSVWIKPETERKDSRFTAAIVGGPIETKTVPQDDPTQIALPYSIFSGQEIDFTILSNHTPTVSSDEKRKLSFVLAGISLD
jgi:hypothetical protein